MEQTNNNINAAYAARGIAAYASAASNVNYVSQVVMLYDGIIKHLSKAKEGILNGSIQERYNGIERACNIILGLRASLDYDKGGEIAQLLNNFYFSIDLRAMEIHFTNDAEACEQIIKEVIVMRDAWKEVEKMGNNLNNNDQKESNNINQELDFKELKI